MGTDKGFWLALDESTRALRAGFTPPATPPQRADIEAAVTASGWTLDALDDFTVEAFLRRCRGATQPFEAVVGHVSNGSFSLDLAADHMSVSLTLTPPQGGTKVREADVLQALTARGIVFGLDIQALRAALAAGECTAVQIATGLKPKPGTRARFESLLEAIRSPGPESDDDNAWVDYRNMGQLLVVPAGAALMRRIPAVPGKRGINVLNQPVSVPPVSDEMFATGLSGVAPDPADPCLLRALIAGAPVLRRRGISVNPLVEVEAVDLASGNIDFEGTLRVKGDVTAGMKIRVSGDVFINGTLEAASVEAGGDVIVQGGIIGSSEHTRNVTHSAGRLAHITCSGSLKARFIINAIISTGQSVIVESEIRGSDITAGDSVLVGPPRGRQGNITGGRIRASRLVSASTLGAPAGTPTKIQAGLNAHADAHKLTLTNMRQRLVEEKGKLEQLVALFRAHPEKAAEGMGERARQTLAKINAELQTLEERETQLIRQLQPDLTASIEARQRLHGGVTLNIAGKIMEIMEDRLGGKAQVEEDHIVIR